MTDRHRSNGGAPGGAPPGGPPPGGALTAASGTPKAVDVSADRRARRLWIILLGGPLVWLAHFAITYLVAEAGCTGGGQGLQRFDPPAPRAVTVTATALALLACLVLGLRAWRHWRAGAGGSAGAHERGRRHGHDGGHPLPDDTATMLGGIGLLLCGFSAAAVLSAGVMTPLLPGCGA